MLSGPVAPVRTCVGCRKRAPASELLRFVATEIEAERFSLIPDPARRRRGRGGHIHPDLACLALAERRRAFGRALRISGVVDTGALVDTVAAAERGGGVSTGIVAAHGTADGGSAEPHPDSKVGRPT